MPISVFADHKKPSHHVSLTDKQGRSIGIIATNSRGEPDPTTLDSSPVDRTAMKTTTGNSKYSDFEPPYTPIVQDNWAGGRGQSEFERDTSKYSDGFRMVTRKANKAYLAGQETFGAGIRTQEEAVPGSVHWLALVGAYRWATRRFTASASFTTGEIWFLVEKRGKPNGVLTVNIRANAAGSPSTILATATLAVATVDDVLSEWRLFSISQALTSGTDYWVEIIGAANDNSQNHWRVATNTTGSGSTLTSIDGITWSAGSNDLYYRVCDTATNKTGIQFEYKGAKYYVDGSAPPKLYMNGDRGAADSNTGLLTTLVDGSKSWTVNKWAGAVVIITNGPGRDEPQPWRNITANTATTLTVDTAWITTHTTATEYTIIGANQWTEITGHGLTAKVTSVFANTKGIVYFAMGDAVNIRRMREYDNAGTWTYEYADDGTNMATFISEGAAKMWRAQNTDVNYDTSVSSSDATAWGTNLTFGTPIRCGNNTSRITGLEIYIDDAGTEALWVMKEDEAGFIKGTTTQVFCSLQLREIATVKSPKNGYAHIVYNTYLYWSLLNGLEQYYRPTLDDMGPNLDDGLPATRQGPVTDLLGYPGRVFAVVDAGSSGYSSILAYVGGGWHEEYRAPKGKPIKTMGFQVVPGVQLDRLWFIQGSDMVWIPFPSDTTNPLNDTMYRYTHEGAIQLSIMTAGMGDATKFVKSLKVETDNLTSQAIVCEIDYRLDSDTAWTTLDEAIETSPVQEIDLTNVFGLSGKRLQFRLRFQTNDNTKTPSLRVFLVEALTRVSNKFAYSIPFTFEDSGLDLLNRPDDEKHALAKINLLNEWATETMVIMRSVDPALDGRLVFCLPVPTRAIIVSEDQGQRKYQGRLLVQDA